MRMEDFYRPQLTFDEEKHLYQWDGEPLVSSTQVIERYHRKFNAKREAQRYAKKHNRDADKVLLEWEEHGKHARELGTFVHAACETMASHIKQRPLQIPSVSALEAAAPYVEAAYSFYLGHPELAGSFGYCLPEVRVASNVLRIAGTVDLLCNLDGVPTILDWKTSEKIEHTSSQKMHVPINDIPDTNFWHYAIQLSIYEVILKRQYSIDIEQRIIVQLGKDGTWAVYQLPDLFNETVVLLEHFLRKRTKKALRKRKS